MQLLDNVELPSHFDNYFSEIASVHKYQGMLASLQKYNIPRIKASLDQLSYRSHKIWPDIPVNLKSLSPYSFEKQYKTSRYLAKIHVDFCFICLSIMCNIVLMSLFSLSYLLPLQMLTPSPVHRHAFLPLFFVYLFYLTLNRCILLLFFCYL